MDNVVMELSVAGLSFGSLIRIFCVFEGFTLWRSIEAQKTVSQNQTDVKKICKSFFRSDEEPEVIVRKYTQLTKAWEAYKFYSKISPLVLEKPYIALACFIVLTAGALYIDYETVVARCLLTWLLLAYMVLKVTIYCRVRYVYKTFVALLKEVVPVDVPEIPESPTWTAL